MQQTAEVLGCLVFLALAAQQIFKRFETYSIPAHTALLYGPPVLASPLLISAGNSPIPSLLLAHAVYLGALSAFILLYRISPFHPLARYPGPIGCKLSQWWPACVSWGGYEHLHIARLHEQYGDVVRIGPNEISIRDADAVAPVMGAASAFAKGPQYVGRMLSDGIHLPLIGIMDTEEHLQRRRVWNKALGAAALREYEDTIAFRARGLVDALERQKGEVVLGLFFNYFAYDFMSDMAFGGGSELLRDGDANNVWKVLDEGMAVGTLLAHVPWLGVYLRHIPAAVAPLTTLIKHCRGLTEARIKRGSMRRDLFHYLNNEDLQEKSADRVPMHQLTDDGCLVVVAGADTTSSALTSLFFLLLTHPEAYARLQAEVDKFYPPGEDAYDPKHHRDMHYLNAVINETLRLFPPVPNGSQRMVPHKSAGATVGEHFFPPGTSVWVHCYSLHRDPLNFSPFPASFWPDRWLLASGAAAPTDPAYASLELSRPGAFAHNDAAFTPFAAGPMNCVGKGLALQEVRTVTCALVRQLAFALREGWDAAAYEREYRAYLVATRPVVPVRVSACADA